MSESSIFSRKSSVNFSPEEITSENIDSIIKASIWAPSSRNKQPWKIIAVRRNSKKFDQLVKSMSAGNQVMANNSGLILIFCTPDESDFSPKTFLDIGFSGQNAMLRATELGLDTHPIGGWDEEKVKSVSNIPDNSRVAFLLIIGKPGKISDLDNELLDKHNKKRERNSLDKNFSFDVWGKDF